MASGDKSMASIPAITISQDQINEAIIERQKEIIARQSVLLAHKSGQIEELRRALDSKRTVIRVIQASRRRRF